MRAGIKAGLPVAAASFLLAVSFGVLARPVLGTIAPIVMSAIVFAGSAQFAALAVLAAGGGPVAAVAAGVLLNTRFLPMGIALAPSLHSGALTRVLTGQAMIDASWAMASRGGGSFDPAYMIGATIPNYPAWVAGTAVGVLTGELIGNPERLGLDAIFPAFFLALLLGEMGAGPRAIAAAMTGVAMALVLAPLTPPGVPIIAASVAALLGLRHAQAWPREDAAPQPGRHPREPAP